MLVIMDMEWVDRHNRICPTQIAALRVTPEWKEEDRFNKLICPESTQDCDWDHMAFNGYDRDDFLRGSDCPTALTMLSAWLGPDDVLCWWGAPTATAFAAVWQDVMHSVITRPLRLISPAIQEDLFRFRLPQKGSAYKLLAMTGISYQEKEHCSADDVSVIRKLLEKLQADPDRILRYRLPDGVEKIQMEDLHKLREYDPSLRYVLDMTHKRAHRTSCDLIPAGCAKRSMATLEGVVRSLMPPCSCCSEEYWRYSGFRAKENIRKMQLNFIYSEKSRLFHKPSCIHVQRMQFPLIHGCIRYETAVFQGFHPCGWCRPKQEDENRHQDYWKDGSLQTWKKPKKPSHTKSKLDAGTLNRFELNAVKRQKQAVKERAALPGNLKGIENHDAHVLSQAGFAFWIAEGYQTFHLRSCPKLNGLSHLRGYARYGEVRRFGTPCKLCKPTKKYDIKASVPMNQRIRKNETVQQIDRLCQRYGWKHEARAEAYYIETPAAKWKLMTGTCPLEVFHMPNGSSGYHKQHRTFLSMTDTVEYIRRHDVPQDEMEVPDPVLVKRQDLRQERKLDRMILKAQKSFQRKTAGMPKKAMG